MIQPTHKAYTCNCRLATKPGKQDRALGKVYLISYPADGQLPYSSFLQELFAYCGTVLPSGTSLLNKPTILGQKFKTLALDSPAIC